MKPEALDFLLKARQSLSARNNIFTHNSCNMLTVKN
jgi:hypothetical protein